MGIKGVVFDFNGTLFWDTNIHNKAWDIFLEKNNIRLSNKEKNKKIHGKNNRDILNILFSNQLSKEEINRLSTAKEKIYQKLCLQTDMQLAPGAKEFLNFLKNMNIPFTIATASGLNNVDFYFRNLELNSFFDRSKVIFNDGSIKSKPNPQIFQKAINIMGLMGCETLIFEDSISGIIAAENVKAAKIIIVNSNDDDYSRWNYQQIKNFTEVDKNLFNK
jgi:beta-phosphoglucomutase